MRSFQRSDGAPKEMTSRHLQDSKTGDVIDFYGPCGEDLAEKTRSKSRN